MKMPSNKFIFYVLFFIGLLIASTTTLFLPERFFLDTNILIYDRYNEIGYKGSYPLTILFYNITGLKHLHFSIIGAIQYTILIYCIKKIGIPERFHAVTIKNLIVYLFFIIAAIYISMPSKEFLTFIFTYFIVRLCQKRRYKLRKTIICLLVALTIFGVMFRDYYLIIVALTVFSYLISRINFKDAKVINILFGISFLIVLSLSYGIVKGEFLSEKTRYKLNQTRLINKNTNANSMILSPIPPDTWYGESFGIVYGFFTVNTPLNAVKHLFSPHILIFSIWQLLLFLILYKRFGNCINEGKTNNYELWLFYVLFSYFIVQGVFEPDLGSAVRHKAGIFPLIYYLLYYEDFRKKLL